MGFEGCKACILSPGQELRMMYKLIIFDLNGTLINIDKLLFRAYEKAVRGHGLEMPDEKAMRVFFHVPKYTFTKAYYELSSSDSYQIVGAYKAAYEELYAECAELFEGALDTLAALNENKIKLVLLADRDEGEVKAVLRRFNVDNLIETVRLNDMAGLTGQLELVISMYGFRKEESLYIGDQVEDMDAAELADVDFLPVTYGYGFEAASEDIDLPIIMLKKISELPAALLTMQARLEAEEHVYA